METVPKKFSLRCTSLIALSMFQSIRIMHKCNILHRDIKPDNIMIGKNHQLKLLDFGFSCSA